MTAKRILFLFKQLLHATFVESVSALRRAVVLAILSALILPPLLVGQGSPLSSESKWIVKILNASWRDSVTIRKPNQDQKNEKPSEGQQWLVLRVELTPPSKWTLNAEGFSLVDSKSARYPVLGRDSGRDIFVLFADMPAGQAVKKGVGEMIGLDDVMLFGKSPDPSKSRSASQVSLLFKVATTRESLHLQIANGAKVPVPFQ
jgi:hypothetical protein